MSIKRKKLKPRFGRETRFTLRPTLEAPFRAEQGKRLEALKEKLKSEKLEQVYALSERLTQAANEAAALAWVTPYPLLVFPVLFEEKADAAAFQAGRQHSVMERSREIMLAV
jgi:hypothetical protein